MIKDRDFYVRIGRIGGINSTHNAKDYHDECTAEYLKSPKLCKRCKKVLTYEQRKNKFCSHRCSALTNNLPGRHVHGVPFPNCLRCGKKLYHHGEMHASCRKEYHKEQVIEMVKSGSYTNSKMIKRCLVLVRGNTCERCKNSRWEGELIPLDAHHIDGDIDNNISTNLILLCPNCHSLTDNYKGKNRDKSKRGGERVWGKHK
jgi:hypothetical protein